MVYHRFALISLIEIVIWGAYASAIICIWQKEILGSTCLYDFACWLWISFGVQCLFLTIDIWSVRENAQRKNEDLNVGNGREREIYREIEKCGKWQYRPEKTRQTI